MQPYIHDIISPISAKRPAFFYIYITSTDVNQTFRQWIAVYSERDKLVLWCIYMTYTFYIYIDTYWSKV